MSTIRAGLADSAIKSSFRELFTIKRNVLFSFLGTTDYRECIYTWHGRDSRPTRFVQTAIIEHLLKETGSLDVVVFVTEDAYRKNWVDGFYKDENGHGKKGLKTCLDACSNIYYEMVSIGQADQSDIANWRLFDRISEEIRFGDILHFDITHSLRPIPIVALAVANYARVIKKARYGRFLYGWFERSIGSGPTSAQPVERKHAPIMDFTPMMRLLDWTNGVDQFLRTGDAGKISETVDDIQHFDVKSNLTEQEQNHLDQLRAISRSLKEAGLSLTTVRGHSMIPDYPFDRQVSYVNALRQLQTDLDALNGEVRTPLYPLKQLISEINRKFAGFGENEAMDLYYAVKWCYENGKIQQAYTFLEENVITLLCRKYHLNDNNLRNRRLIARAIGCFYHNKEPKNDDKFKNSQEVQTAKRVIDTISQYGNLFKRRYNQLRKYRNNMNHASMDQSNFPMDQLGQTMKKLLDQFYVFFRDEGGKMQK